MTGCCAHFERAADQQFNRQKAEAELRRYRVKGPRPTARLLEDGVAETGALGGTLLDVGSGIGSLTFALLTRGMAHATVVDASSAYIETARQEAARQGLTGAVLFVQADFVSVATELPTATVVTLDRVVCCYPSHESLLTAVLPHARRCLALSYPRGAWYVRLAMWLENARRWLARNPFRTFVHPPAGIDHVIRQDGFTLASRRETWMWTVDVYTR